MTLFWILIMALNILGIGGLISCTKPSMATAALILLNVVSMLLGFSILIGIVAS